MKKLLCCLLLTVASLPAAQVEDWLKSGLLHPDLIASVREQLALTEEQQTKLNSQLSEARAQAEPGLTVAGLTVQILTSGGVD